MAFFISFVTSWIDTPSHPFCDVLALAFCWAKLWLPPIARASAKTAPKTLPKDINLFTFVAPFDMMEWFFVSRTLYFLRRQEKINVPVTLECSEFCSGG
jgi:hypothetical protein